MKRKTEEIELIVEYGPPTAASDAAFRTFMKYVYDDLFGDHDPLSLADAEVASLRAAQQRLNDHRPTRALADSRERPAPKIPAR